MGLAAVAGRQKMSFRLDQHALALLDHAEGFDSADLILRAGRFNLHLVITLPDLAFEPTGEVVGVGRHFDQPLSGAVNWSEVLITVVHSVLSPRCQLSQSRPLAGFPSSVTA